ncbi:MAG: hypothetical protein WCQ21_17750 [Verrucomicrobiota bacterium]
MPWFRKKPDLITDHARALNDEIARLESQIQQLDAQVERDQSQPRLRSTALPHGSTVSHSTSTPGAPPAPAPHEPIFEEMGRPLLEGRGEGTTTPEHFNELGVRKYDLPALLRRVREHFRGPSTSNPKLVSYLAAGGIQGLRPLRYEKRVARNRFIAFVAILFLLLLGTLVVFLKGQR